MILSNEQVTQGKCKAHFVSCLQHRIGNKDTWHIMVSALEKPFLYNQVGGHTFQFLQAITVFQAQISLER